MIDIIIPAYNAHDTICKTLFNLTLQESINKATIYIVNDCSIKDYKKEISFFKSKMKIIELRTPKNMGPGAARQYALTKSKGEYIIFLDADDQLYNSYILNSLYACIKHNKMDMVYGEEIIEDKGINVDCTGSLHGKIYRRSFIEKNNIKFNNTRYSEDDSFNKLIMSLSKKTMKINMTTYLYLNNPISITNDSDKKVKALKMYIYNMIWLALELKKRKQSDKKIANILLIAYAYVYKDIKNHYETNFSNLFGKCYRLEELYSKYEKHLSKQTIKTIIKKNIYCENEKTIISDFDNFRNKFKYYNNKIDIIIPAYNAHDCILDSLYSIAQQTISDKVNVYIVNDGSQKNYKKEINMMKSFINVKELTLPKRIGPCGARQYGVDHSSAEYILFLDADDILNDGLALKGMRNYMNEYKCDVASSIYNRETETNFTEYSYNTNALYGKIYRRSFLNKYNIRFNDTFMYADESFSNLIYLITNVFYYDSFTYIKRNYLNSFYKVENTNINKIHDKFENILWVIMEAQKRNSIKSKIYNYICEQIVEVYISYLESSNDTEKTEILKYSKELYEYFSKYKLLYNQRYNDEYIKKILLSKLIKFDGSKITNINVSFSDFLGMIEVHDN